MLKGYMVTERLETPALDGNILLKFVLETRLKSVSSDILDDLLKVWVQKS